MSFTKLKSTLKKLTVLLLIAQGSISVAQDIFFYHPELDWSTFETEHFYVHFHQGTQRTAELVGKIAEDIYVPVTKLYDYQPEGKIHFIIKDTDDYSNGAAYFFDNKIEIWAQNLDYIMRGTKNWLRDVVTHEFIHMIQIQKSIKTSTTVPYGFFQYFNYEPERRKDVVRGFPNTIVSYPISSISIPVWFAEGVAHPNFRNFLFELYNSYSNNLVIRTHIGFVALPDRGCQGARLSGDGLLIQGQQLASMHQNLSSDDRGRDHAFVETEDDLPGKVASAHRCVGMIIHKDEISMCTR